MNFMHISMILSIFVLIGSTLQWTCNDCILTKSQVQASNEYQPGKATSFNLRQIMDEMARCGIQRAQVSGWDAADGIYVVYQNGAVVPALPYDLPEYAVYFKMCGNNVEKIVFVHEVCDKKIVYPICPCAPCESPFFNPCQNEVVCVNPVCQNEVVYVNPVCQNNEPPIVEFNPVLIENELICETRDFDSWCPEDGFSCNRTECRTFPKVCKKVSKRSGRRRKELEVYSKQYHLTCKRIGGERKVLLIEKVKDKKVRDTVYVLNGKFHLPIKILNDPWLLRRIFKKIKQKFGPGFCLYVNDHSCVYVLFKEHLYCVKYDSECIKVRRVNPKDRCKIVKNGLYLVTMGN
ncbi:uncharacterized protein VICG_01219 [Vittaforma corneae ATCC 50505]|uniref:Uncharacterized protein n=1 Tax=Vittaforma corneae (strain ATCC 50505) TaxID=993615 RepID=L2GMJ8_VITCO|nr:uncharacterized protein VICG_01219 [Vittaforma corneae ATCC 50505]ELA41715.1 hypothetical protein VICG_01219 [Vittaforma corneae ATCC 50505]